MALERSQTPAFTYKDAPSVMIVILNWNTFEETKKATLSALQTQYPKFSVLVVDNGSTRDSINDLNSLSQEKVEVVCLPENRGFTGGCNYGLDLALSRNIDYVWLLNNDAETEPHTLASLVQQAEKTPAAGLISPRIVSRQDPSREVFTGGLFEPDVPAIHSTEDPLKVRHWSTTAPDRLVLAGTALLVKMTLARSIGLLDEPMFAYWEDIDYSVRSLNAGFRNLVDFDSAVLHHDKFAGPGPHPLAPHWRYYMARNVFMFWRKHAHGLKKYKVLWWTLKYHMNELQILRHDRSACTAICAALWDALLHRTGAYVASREAPVPVASLLRWIAARRKPL